MPGSVKAAVLLASVTLALLTGFEVSREAYFISRILVHAEGLEPVRAGAARNVASGDVAAPVFQQHGERGHSDASYAGEMDLPVHHSPHNERMCATERRSESSSTACDGSKTTWLTFLAKSASAAKSTLPSPGAK